MCTKIFATKYCLTNNVETRHSKSELQQLAVSSIVRIIEVLNVFQTEQTSIAE